VFYSLSVVTNANANVIVGGSFGEIWRALSFENLEFTFPAQKNTSTHKMLRRKRRLSMAVSRRCGASFGAMGMMEWCRH